MVDTLSPGDAVVLSGGDAGDASLEVLPGAGWDNRRDKSGEVVFVVPVGVNRGPTTSAGSGPALAAEAAVPTGAPDSGCSAPVRTLGPALRAAGFAETVGGAAPALVGVVSASTATAVATEERWPAWVDVETPLVTASFASMLSTEGVG